MANWRGTFDSGSIYAPGDEVAYAGTNWLCTATVTGQVPVPGSYWAPQAIQGSPSSCGSTYAPVQI